MGNFRFSASIRPAGGRLVPGFAAALLMAATASVQAVVVTPIVSDSSAAAVTSGIVPPGLIDFAIDVQPTNASAALTVSNDFLFGAETADGAAEVSIDPADINNSEVKSRSRVSTANAPAPVSDFIGMADRSAAGISSTLSTAGLAPGDSASVDLLLDVSGSLIYSDPAGTASSVVVENPFDPTDTEISPDMSADVSVLLAIADLIDITTTSVFGVDIPDPLPFFAPFNGSAILRSTEGIGTAPELILTGDWADPARSGDFVTVGTCDATFCQIDVSTSILFTDVQSLGVGETFEMGLALLTNAEAISGQDPVSGEGRFAESNFFDTATVDVSLALVPSSEVPEPGTLLLFLVGFAAAGMRRRRGSGAGRPTGRGISGSDGGPCAKGIIRNIGAP